MTADNGKDAAGAATAENGASAPAGAPTPEDLAGFHEILSFALSGYQLMMIPSVTKLGVADVIGDGQKPISEIAEATGANEANLRRTLRVLVARGIFKRCEDTPDGEPVFANSPQSKTLRRHDPLSMWGFFLFYDNALSPAMTKVAEFLEIKEGSEKTSPFDMKHGKSFWPWMEDNPKTSDAFSQFMGSLGAQRVAVISHLDASVAAKDGDVICDVGGAHGDLLVPLLDSRPGAKGSLFDLAPTIDIAEKHLQAGTCALAKHKARVSVARGDFFKADTIPQGAALYILGFIVHDWSDEDAVRILSNVATAMPADGWIIVIDQVLPDTDEGNQVAAFDAAMLCLLPGAIERTVAHSEELYGKAGLALDKVVTPVPGLPSMHYVRKA